MLQVARDLLVYFDLYVSLVFQIPPDAAVLGMFLWSLNTYSQGLWKPKVYIDAMFFFDVCCDPIFL